MNDEAWLTNTVSDQGDDDLHLSNERWWLGKVRSALPKGQTKKENSHCSLLFRYTQQRQIGVENQSLRFTRIIVSTTVGTFIRTVLVYFYIGCRSLLSIAFSSNNKDTADITYAIRTSRGRIFAFCVLIYQIQLIYIICAYSRECRKINISTGWVETLVFSSFSFFKLLSWSSSRPFSWREENQGNCDTKE